MDTGNLFLLGSGLKAGSQVGAGFGAYQDGRTARDVANYEAAGYDRQAADEVAAAQRVAIERRKATDRAVSKQIALGAASGSAVSSPGLLDIIGDTAQFGEYQAQADQYVGDERAAGLRDKARVRRVEGEAAATRGRNAFVGSVLESIAGVGTRMDEYRRTYGTRARARVPDGTDTWMPTLRYG